MKTIKQIADEIGVSKQAIQKRISKEPLYTVIQEYISIVDSTKYIDVDGETLIKSAYKKSRQIVADNIHANQPTTAENEVYSILRETIDTLRKQLEVKDKQIDDLTQTIREQAESIKQQAESINAERKNELAETIITGQQRLTNGKKEGLFKRFFQKKGTNI